jgi:hypothetical protein
MPCLGDGESRARQLLGRLVLQTLTCLVALTAYPRHQILIEKQAPTVPQLSCWYANSTLRVTRRSDQTSMQSHSPIAKLCFHYVQSLKSFQYVQLITFTRKYLSLPQISNLLFSHFPDPPPSSFMSESAHAQILPPLSVSPLVSRALAFKLVQTQTNIQEEGNPSLSLSLTFPSSPNSASSYLTASPSPSSPPNSAAAYP